MLPKKTIPVLLIGLMIVLAAVFIIPSSSGDTLDTGFGTFRVEVIAADCCETMQMQPSSVLGNMLSFTKEGDEVHDFTIKIYATATGSGFDSCELDFSDSTTQLQYSLNDGNLGSETHDLSPLETMLPLGVEKQLFVDTIHLEDLINGNPASQSVSFDAYFESINFKFRGVSNDGNGPWESSDVSFSVESDTQLTWNWEDPCGDGSCKNEPYPGENCMSCSEDCGSCNGRIRPSDRSFIVEDSSLLGKDIWDIQRTYYTGSGWSSWSKGNTNWEHVEVFEYNNNFCAYVWPSSSAVGATLNGQCRIRPIYSDGSKGTWINLPQVDESWNDLGDTITSSDTSNGISGYWRTDWWENHRLTHNGKYEMQVYYWLDGVESPDPVLTPPQTLMASNDVFADVGEEVDLSVEARILNENDDEVNGISCYTEISWADGTDSSRNTESGDIEHFYHTFDSEGTYIVTGRTRNNEAGEWGTESSFPFYVDVYPYTMVSSGLFTLSVSSQDVGMYEYNGKTLGG